MVRISRIMSLNLYTLVIYTNRNYALNYIMKLCGYY